MSKFWDDVEKVSVKCRQQIIVVNKTIEEMRLWIEQSQTKRKSKNGYF